MKIAITGTTSGIGLETLKLLEAEGHEVVSFNRPEYDLHDLDNISKIDLSGFDVLINNAAHNKGRHDSVLNHPFPDWVDVVTCNQLAPVLLTQLFCKQNPTGTVVFITSKWSAKSSTMGFYRTSKQGLKDYIECMRMESKDHRFVEIMCGRVRTQFRTNEQDPNKGEDWRNYKDESGLVGTDDPKDVARQVVNAVNDPYIAMVYIKHPDRGA